jgi:hypothetical protein
MRVTGETTLKSAFFRGSGSVVWISASKVGGEAFGDVSTEGLRERVRMGEGQRL